MASPKCSVIGPIYFLIFFTDLPDLITSVCRIFADDTNVYNTSNNKETLQKDLNNLKHWRETWQLYFNRSKCKCLYYDRNNPEENYTSDGPELKGKGTEEKDLGVIFDPSLKFNKHINTV